MSTASYAAVVLIHVMLAVGAVILIWLLMRLDTDDGADGDGGGGGGGGQRLRPPPRHRGPHGGLVPPSPQRVRSPVVRTRRGPRVHQ